MITFIIGDQRSGKSTLSTLYARLHMLHAHKVYSTLYLAGATQIKIEDLMIYELEKDSIVVLDEAATSGLGARGGLYSQNTTANVVEFFTMHNHYHVKEVIIVSPSFKDIIPVVRDNADIVICVKRSVFNRFGFIKTKTMGSRIDIVGKKGEGSAPDKIYYWVPFSTRYYWNKPAFDMFDTYTRRPLKSKIDWHEWKSGYVPKKKVILIKNELINKAKRLLPKKIFKKVS